MTTEWREMSPDEEKLLMDDFFASVGFWPPVDESVDDQDDEDEEEEYET